MNVTDEIKHFDDNVSFLDAIVAGLNKVESSTATPEQMFIAEAVAFRLFRIFERFSRAVFLDSCASSATSKGTVVKSKLICGDWETAEQILKAGNRFLEWGNIERTADLAKLVFENGFPVSDMFRPIHGTLLDLKRIRNFIAHDSDEAKSGFQKIISQYLSPSLVTPDTAGRFLLARRSVRKPQTLRIVFDKVREITTIYGEL